jgi:3-phenylpropionate/cinnamic acid dioxygenase small subunit
VTRSVDDGDELTPGLAHFDETKGSIAARILRLAEPTAWAEHPRSRTRHLVTNVRVWSLDDGYAVRSALLFVRSRGGAPGSEVLAGERRDVLRRGGPGLLLARREIVLDQASLGVSNLSTFL